MTVGRTALAVVLALFVGACSITHGRMNSTAPTNSAATGNPWTHHGIVRFAEQEEPNTLIRMFSNQASADDVTALLFEPFFRFDERERPVPVARHRLP